jgi:hypothetical protein
MNSGRPVPAWLPVHCGLGWHDRPWRVAVERGYFCDEGLDVEYHDDNPKGVAGRVENFSERRKESQLQKGARVAR